MKKLLSWLIPFAIVIILWIVTVYALWEGYIAISFYPEKAEIKIEKGVNKKLSDWEERINQR